MPYKTAKTDNNCLKLMQKTQEDYLMKRTIASKLCSCQIEYQGWSPEKYKIAFDCQLDDDIEGVSCKTNATNECKAAAIDFYTTAIGIASDPKLENCIDFKFLRESKVHRYGNLGIISIVANESYDAKRGRLDSFINKILTTCKV